MKTIERNISKLIWKSYIINKLFEVILALIVGSVGISLFLIFIILSSLDILITWGKYAKTILWRNNRWGNKTRQ